MEAEEEVVGGGRQVIAGGTAGEFCFRETIFFFFCALRFDDGLDGISSPGFPPTTVVGGKAERKKKKRFMNDVVLICRYFFL